MNNLSLKWIVSSFSLAILTSITVNGQCPDVSTNTTNGHCFFATWENPPVPLPLSVVFNNVNYTLQSGSGTSTSPAIYKGSGGNGACNAGDNPFSGTLEVGGETCNYINGELQGGTPLPVDLISFDAVVNNGQVLLIWKTSFEFENREFRVERLDQSSFHTWRVIDMVPGNNNYDDFITYRAIDQAPARGRNQYRLVQVDLDGSETPSGIVSVFVDEGGRSLKLLPNPASTKVEILGISAGTAEIYSVSGTLISSHIIHQTKEIDVSYLSSGVYVVKVLNEGTVSTEKLIVN